MAGFGGSVKLTGESEYKRALAGINQSLKETASELKAVNSVSGVNAKDTEVMAQKSAALNKQLEQQTNKVKTLEAQYKEFEGRAKEQTKAHEDLEKQYKTETDKLGELEKTLGKTSPEYKAQEKVVAEMGQELAKSAKAEDDNAKSMSNMRIEINKAQADVNKTTGEIDKLGKETEETGKQAESTGKRFEGLRSKLGNTLKVIGTSMAALGAGAVAAGKQLWDAADNAATFGDEIDKQSQKVGLTYEAYQQWDYAMARAGTSMAATTTGLKTLTNKLDDARNGSKGATQQFANLGISMEELQGKSREEVFARVVTALQGVTDETRKAALANDMFGKSGQDLMPMFNQTAEETQRLLDEAKEYGMVMGDDAVKASAAFKDSLAKLKGTMTGVKNSMTGSLLPGITQITDGLSDLFAGKDGAVAKIQDGADSIVKSIGDMVPKFLDLIKGLVQGVMEAAPDILGSLAKGIMDAMPSLLSTATTVISKFISTMGQMLPTLIPQLIQTITTLLTDGIPVIMTSAVQMLMGIVKAVPTIVTELSKAVPQIANAIVSGLVGAAYELEEAMYQLFMGVPSQAALVADALNAEIQSVIDFRTALEESEPVIVDYNNLMSSQGNKLTDLKQITQTAEDGITAILKKAKEENRKIRDDEIKDMQSYLQQIADAQAQELEIYRSQQVGELRRLQLEAGQITAATADDYLKKLSAGLDAANGASQEAYKKQLELLENQYTMSDDMTEAAYRHKQQTLEMDYRDSMEKNNKLYQDSIALVQQKTSDLVNVQAQGYGAMTGDLANFTTTNKNEFQKYILDQVGKAGGLREMVAPFRAVWAQMDQTQANAFLNINAEFRKSGQELDDQAKATAKGILDPFEGLTYDLDKAGHDVLMGLIMGMEDEIPALKNASNMTSQEIVDTIKNYLQIGSPSKVMYQYGEWTVEGLVNGMKSGKSTIQISTVVRGLITGITNAFKNSNSEMLKIGSTIATSISDGIKRNSAGFNTAVNSLINAIKTAFNSNLSAFTEIGKKIAQNIGNGMSSDSSGMTRAARGLVNTATSALNSFMSSFRSIGANMADGIVSGFAGREAVLKSMLRSIMSRVVDGVNFSLKINSPSKVMAETGKFMADGIGMGFGDEMRTVSRDMQSAIPTSELVSGGQYGANSSESRAFEQTDMMVRSFKRALEEMKIELDDEVAGRFVEKTVTKAIYA